MAATATPDTLKTKLPDAGKTFAQALSGDASGSLSDEILFTKLPPKVVMGPSVRVKISQAAYESGLAACKTNLHGRLTLHKGDQPLTTQALKTKLNNLWPHLRNWSLIPLGKGFFEFNFNSIEDMKLVWALGVVQLKPGFLRFYCWTKDFTPKSLAQTHAQVWVRFLQLPQEYWGRQTLFEIASGLGTPITIDEATQNKRFGLFARILIDVDMAEQLFESVIVEREGHAMTIMVQYEKRPLFCAHCKNIGHSVHSCSKLVAASNMQTKGHNGFHKSQMPNKKSVPQRTDAPILDIAPSNTIAAGNLSAKTPAPIEIHNIHEETFDSADDFEEGEIPASDGDVTEGFKRKQPIVTHSMIHGEKENLQLHNSFGILDKDSVQAAMETGEATSGDKEFSFTKLDMQIDKNPIVKGSSLEKENLSHSTNLEVSRKLVIESSNSVALNSSLSLLDSANGRRAFPITDPSSLGQTSTIGRVTFPNAISESHDRDPAFVDSTLKPVLAPVTFKDELMGQARRRVHLPAAPKNISVACYTDGKVLRKFWGDEDTDATDSSLGDTDNEAYKLTTITTQSPKADKYLVPPFEKVKTTKKGRPKKLKCPNTASDTPAQLSPTLFKAAINTRSQTGRKSQTKIHTSQ